jgi:hypothetical protein
MIIGAMKSMSLKAIKDLLDIIAAIAGIFLGSFIISLYYVINLRQQDIGFVILSASLIYLLLRSKFKKGDFTPLKINHRGRLLLNIIFFTVFSITLLIWHTHLYFRPLSYFILICLLAGIIAIEILYFKEGDPAWSILLKILLLSANIRAGIFYNFPSLMGYDAYAHARIAELTTNTGFVVPFEISGKYFYYPVAHIFLSITQIVNQIDIKDAIFCSIGLVSIISTIFIYLIGKKLAGPQIGLLATLLANVTNVIIVRGITNITTGSLVLCYFMLILYLIFKEDIKHKVINMSLIIFITFLMITTHQLSTFVVLISLTSICFAKIAYNYVYKHEEGVAISTSYILLFAVALQSYWMHTYMYPGQTFFDAVVGPFISVLESGGEYGSNVLIVGLEYQKPLLDTLLLHSSYLILPFFAIGGVLLWLSLRDNKKFSFVTAVIILYSFVYGIPLLGMRNMLTSRWVPLLSVFLVIVASAYIFENIELIKSNRNKIFAIFTIAVIFSFFMITTPGINKDNPMVAKDTTCRNQFKDSEASAAKTISNVYTGRIKVDPLMGTCFSEIRASSVPRIESKLLFEGFGADYIASSTQEECVTMIMLRKCTSNEPISVEVSKLYGVYRIQSLPKEFFARFESNDYDLVYNNSGVLGYISR